MDIHNRCLICWIYVLRVIHLYSTRALTHSECLPFSDQTANTVFIRDIYPATVNICRIQHFSHCANIVWRFYL